MKKINLIFVFLFVGSYSIFGQTYNPKIQSLQFVIPPTASGFECGSTQNVTFNQSISTVANATQWQLNPLTVSICLTGFVFEGPVSSIISGTYASNFTWAYDNFAPNCIVGVQNQTLFGTGGTIPVNPLSTGSINFSIKVPLNTALATSLGVNVNLQVPGYMQQGNSQTDDNATIQTISFCSCYDFLTNAGTVASTQYFYNSGDPVAFTSTNPGSGGATGGAILYQWQELIGTTWTDISGATGLTYDAPFTTVTRSYRRAAKRSNCGTWIYSTPVVVNIAIPNGGLDQTINCATTSVIIGMPSSPGITYAWSPSTGLSSSTIAQPIASPTASTTYTVTFTNPNNVTATDIVFVNVNTSPPAVVTNPSASASCPNSTATIAATGATSYEWLPGGLTGTSISVNPQTTTTYTITGTGANGCVSTITHVVTVNPLPTVGTTVTLATVCIGQSTTITGTGANIYTWNFGASYSPTLTVAPGVATTYAVIGVNTTTGCTNIALRTISVNPTPTISTTASPTSICAGSSSTITAGGNATSFSWQPGSLTGNPVTVSPLTTTIYTVTGTNSVGCTKTSTRLITVTSCGSTLNLKLFIEGYYAGSSLMVPALFNQTVPGATSTRTDTIIVELRNVTAPYGIAASLKTILNTNGTATCVFPISGTYYIAVKHRNALQTWSANPVTVSAVPLNYDFSNAITKAYGDNMVLVGPGVYAFYSGELNGDENVDLLDVSQLDLDIANFEFGYLATDLNGDGNADLLDNAIMEANVNNFVFAYHP